MTPYDQIYSQYAQHPQARTFSWYIEWHLRHGFVFSTPEYFVMGRPVNMAHFDPDASEIHVYSRESSDAWYIHAMAGEMPKLWAIMPWDLPQIGWERVRDGKRELSFFSTEDLRRLCPPHEITSH